MYKCLIKIKYKKTQRHLVRPCVLIQNQSWLIISLCEKICLDMYKPIVAFFTETR